jgi:hypothetical protein
MKPTIFPAAFSFIGIILFFVAYNLAKAEPVAFQGSAVPNNVAGVASFGFSIAGGMALIAAALSIRKVPSD